MINENAKAYLRFLKTARNIDLDGTWAENPVGTHYGDSYVPTQRKTKKILVMKDVKQRPCELCATAQLNVVCPLESRCTAHTYWMTALLGVVDQLSATPGNITSELYKKAEATWQKKPKSK